MNDQWYVVDNLPEFILSTRKLIFNNFGKKSEESESINKMFEDINPNDQDEFDTVLTQEESMVIAKGLMKKQFNKKTKAERYLITDKMYMQLIEDMNDRMVSNVLNNLVNKGLLETGYDAESDDFVFWIKDNEKEIPETD